jgi:DNA primase
VVVEPEPEHVDLYVAGRLAIPYITRAGVVNMRFRAMDASEPKYLGLPDAKPRLYGVESLFDPSPIVGITEGELDRNILVQCGIPAVGCPGVSTWMDYHPALFAGYDRVLIFADGDDAGKAFAKRVRKDLDNGVTVTMPDGMDVNDLYLRDGAEALRERAGL